MSLMSYTVKKPLLAVYSLTKTTNPCADTQFFATLQKHFRILTEDEIESSPSSATDVFAAFVSPYDIEYIQNNLDRFPNLRIVANHGVGVNHINFKLMNSHGIKVSNTPGVLSDAAADLGMALMLASARKLSKALKLAMEPAPNFLEYICGFDVSYATLGIVGMGSIGYEIAQRAKAFKMKILYNNRNQRCDSDETDVGATYYANLDDMLPLCDFVMISCPMNTETKNLFGKKEFQLMKKTATLINIARGGIIDQEALFEALSNKDIHGAALDVTEPEPLPKGHPLLTLDNILITCHVGSATIQTRQKMKDLMLKNVLAELDGRPLFTEVKK